TGDIEQVEKRAYWRAGKRRWFFSATVELGNIYARSGGAIGYGQPHWFWGGLEANGSISPGGASDYAGLRFSTPWIDARAGARYTTALSQHFIARRDTY